MKTILSTLVALSVLGSVAITAANAEKRTSPRTFWDQQDADRN